MNPLPVNTLLESKLPKVTTSIFTVMSRLAQEHNAINLSQGFPDFACSPALIDLVNKYMRRGFNQYAPMQGVMKLREKIAEKTEDLYGIKYNPETQITITSGATEALFAAIATLIRPGDEAILFEPAYDSYAPVIELFGGVCKNVSLSLPGYNIDWSTVKEALSPKTRLIIVNSPHNPTGAVITEDDLLNLSAIIKTKDIFVIADEVYEHIVFDGKNHNSLMLESTIREKAFIISSFGKTFHTTGWKIGYCLAPELLTAEFRKIHQYLTFSTNTPMQYALADFLDDKDNYIHLRAFYEEKRNLFSALIASSRFKIMPCSGTYFQLLSYAHMFEENDYDLALRLTKEKGVAAIPVSVFYKEKTDNKVLRFCFAKENSTLEAAAERLCKI